MKRILRKSTILIMLMFSVLLIMPGCATSRKNSYQAARKNSYIDTSQLGRNKYFFSKQYQKKLYRFKKK
jgi:uncharacterized protein YceK